jgi:hypothetical protein
MMLWLVALTASTCIAQHVKPVLLPDSDFEFLTSRSWMEYAVESMELRPLLEQTIEDLQNEILAANDQIYYRDMTLQNLENDVTRLNRLVDTVGGQFDLSQNSLDLVEDAYRKAIRWRNVGLGSSITFAVVLSAVLLFK